MKIIRAYSKSNEFSHDEYSYYYFMAALTTDMLLFLYYDFENYTWQCGFTSPSLKERCPDLTEDNMDDLPYLTFFLWKQMTTSMKLDFYEHTRRSLYVRCLLYCLLKKLKVQVLWY